jgi:outer membrane murein-binding lipoprotein Lpp
MVFLATAFGQERSDFQIVKGFQTKYKEILKLAQEVQTVQQCAEVSVMIDELVKEFSGDKDLLNKALYGEKFDDRVDLARVQLKRNQEKLGLIESQVTRIAELETKVRELSGQVEKLTSENAALAGDVERLGNNVRSASDGATADAAMNARMIDSLKGAIAKLQNNLRERDKLIFALVDSLFMQYDKNLASMNEVEKSGVLAKVERNNVFTNVKKTIGDNLQFLNATDLTGGDLAAMIREQQKFSAQWKAFGPKLANIYSTGKNKKNELALIDTLLSTWEEKVNATFWKQLNADLQKNGVQMAPVFSGERFAQELSGYMEFQSKVEDKAARSAKFDSFTNSVWNGEIGKTWIPLLSEKGMLTADQKKSLEARYDAWRSSVSGPSLWVYVLIALVLGGIAWAGYRRMQKPPAKT